MRQLINRTGGALLLTLFILLGIAVQKVQAQARVNVSFQTFYSELSPYGQWIDDPTYGYVWAPQVGRDFRPYYSNGHWVMTEYGNTWVSSYPWGWAPFHYGRWIMDPYYGWVWVPDTVWGPAWVSWRSGGGNYGWAPLMPGISINVSFGPNYYVPYDYWVFVPQRYIYNPRFHSHYRGPQYNRTVINNTTIINNTYINNNRTYVTGPRSAEVERATGQRVNTHQIQNQTRPDRAAVSGNVVRMYRPDVQQRSRSVSPERVVKPERAIVRPETVRQNSERQNGGREVQRAQPGQRAEQQAVQERQRTDRTQPMQRAEQQAVQERQRTDRTQPVQRAEQQAVQERQRSGRDQQMQRAEQQAVQERQRADRQRAVREQQVQRQRVEQQRRDAERQREMQNRQQERERVQQQRAERARQQERIERNRQQHWERQQRAQPQRTEQRAQPQRIERSKPQRTERAQPRQTPRAGGNDRRGR